MRRAIGFGKRVLILILCLLAVWSVVSPASAAITEDIDTYMEDRRFTKVRSGTSSGSLVIGNLEDGTQVDVIKSYGNYYCVACYGMTGYVRGDQIRIDDNGYYYVNCNPDSGETVTLSCSQTESMAYLQDRIRQISESLLGVPYVYGGTSPRGFDCSGFVQYVYRQMGYNLTRTAVTQLADGLIVDPEELQVGDLVFFHGTYDVNAIASHVGIYVGDGLFIHASNSGIAYDTLERRNWNGSFLCARRVILPEIAAFQESTNQDVKRSGLEDRSIFLAYGVELSLV